MSFLSDLFGPVFPPDVFLVGDLGATFYHFDRPSKGAWRLVAVRENVFEPQTWHEQPLGRSPIDAKSLGDAVVGARRLAGGKLSRASIVVPDRWIRIFLVDFESLPGSARETDEMVAWKLKKLLPFRPDEFRFSWSPVVEASGSARRIFVVGILEKVAAGLESAFAAEGVRIGSITPESLALLAVAGGETDGQTLVVSEESGFQIIVVNRGQPVLYRSKRFSQDDADDRGELVRRELDLTQAFLSQGAGMPSRFRLWQEPAQGSFDLAEVVSSVAGREVEWLRTPPSVEIAGEFPAALARRAAIAVGTFIEGSGS